MYCLNASTGAELWRFYSYDVVHTAVLSADDARQLRHPLGPCLARFSAPHITPRAPHAMLYFTLMLILGSDDGEYYYY